MNEKEKTKYKVPLKESYIELLRAHGVMISMTENGDPYENAIAERVNGILKEEFCLSETFAGHDEAARHVDESIQIYNTRRPHLTCNLMTPEVAHQASTLKLKSWIRKRGSQPDPVSPMYLT